MAPPVRRKQKTNFGSILSQGGGLSGSASPLISMASGRPNPSPEEGGLYSAMSPFAPSGRVSGLLGYIVGNNGAASPMRPGYGDKTLAVDRPDGILHQRQDGSTYLTPKDTGPILRYLSGVGADQSTLPFAPPEMRLPQSPVVRQPGQASPALQGASIGGNIFQDRGRGFGALFENMGGFAPSQRRMIPGPDPRQASPAIQGSSIQASPGARPLPSPVRMAEAPQQAFQSGIARQAVPLMGDYSYPQQQRSPVGQQSVPLLGDQSYPQRRMTGSETAAMTGLPQLGAAFSPLAGAMSAMSGGVLNANVEGRYPTSRIYGLIDQGRQRLADTYNQNLAMFNERWANRNMVAQTNENWSHSPLANFEGRPGGVDRVTEAEIAGFNAQAPARYGQGGSMGAEMLGRADYFAGAGAANQDMLQRQVAGEGVMMQVGGYGSPLTFAPQRQSAEDTMAQAQQNMEAARVGQSFDPNYRGPFTRSGPRRLGSPFKEGEVAYTSREQALRDNGLTDKSPEIKAILDDREERKARVAENRRALGLPVGPVERRAARDAERQQNLIRGQRINSTRMGISPTSSVAAGLFPELHQSAQAARGRGRALARGGDASPLSAAPDLSSPRGQQEATVQSQAVRESGAVLPSLGLEPTAQYADIRDSIAQRVKEQGPQSLDDSALAELQVMMAEFGVPKPGEDSPFADHVGMFGEDKEAGRINELWSSLGKAGRTPKDRENWLKSYLSTMSEIEQIRRQREQRSADEFLGRIRDSAPLGSRY